MKYFFNLVIKYLLVTSKTSSITVSTINRMNSNHYVLNAGQFNFEFVVYMCIKIEYDGEKCNGFDDALKENPFIITLKQLFE